MKILSWDASCWAEKRSGYAYPGAHLVEATNDEDADLVIRDRRLVTTLYERTGAELEGHHKSLLNSHHEIDVLHGVASTIYWGFYAASDPKRRPKKGYAVERAHWPMRGKKGSPLDRTAATAALAKNGAAHARAGCWAEALSCYAKVYGVGFSFGSKLASHADERACIYDDVISERLRQLSIIHVELSDLVTGVSGPISNNMLRAYQRWCDWCQSKAQLLNSSLCNWQVDGVSQRWRAIDVERALFALGRA